jgi:hypothetical protein
MNRVESHVQGVLLRYATNPLSVWIRVVGSKLRVEYAYRSFTPDYQGFNKTDFELFTDQVDASLEESFRCMASSNPHVLFVLWNNDEDETWKRILAFLDNEGKK